jgi:hypothetical protein
MRVNVRWSWNKGFLSLEDESFAFAVSFSKHPTPPEEGILPQAVIYDPD